MKRSLITTLLVACSLAASLFVAAVPAQAQTVTSTYQFRSAVQKYATVAALQAETYAAKPADLVQVEAINTAFVWNATSVATDDGVNVVKQTSIATGRWINSAFNQVFNVAGVNIPALPNQSCAVLSVTVTGVVAGKSQVIKLASGSTITAGITLIETINNTANAVELQACNNTGAASTAFTIGLTVLQK
jgi:hypothetical protein